ncbi:hypothetical protein SH580_05995 [Coraliomargarita algicola]|uniref:Uncharacterized protein n=1 Tax=Coraliomargarita algicola TaxID=3092156 RepID=A0ABZ0RQ30_9BACT|nr:hypothetical protein [Coraliomargarita sp. J2-16]WPJ97258.1 hypothetical protein SH580_05995 [Coraliomargarita sp. J2-16]
MIIFEKLKLRNWFLAILACCSLHTLVGKEQGFAVAKDIPTYLQEWHIWWGFPFPDTDERIGHMEANFDQYREPWRLNWDRNGYPLPGLYDSGNLEIIRWQIRCIKATGVKSVAIMVHPDMVKGLVFIQEKDDFLNKILDIAAEEDFQVFFMDEVAFRKGSVSQDPEVMAQRIIRFIKKYGSHQGFFKINNEPVYYYQTWGYWVGQQETETMIETVENEVGPVHWMVFGDINRLGEIEQIDDVIGVANINRMDSRTREWDSSKQSLEALLRQAKQYGKNAGELIYPKFDGTAQPWRTKGVAMYGDGGNVFVKSVEEAMRHEPDLLMFSSWNDWEEGANFEPGWDFDGYMGDPYAYCRALAKVNGVEFVPPPPPSKSAVHPTIWEKFGYGDGAGPIIEDVRRSHDKGNSLEVTVRDSVSRVTELELVQNGDVFWISEQPSGLKLQGGLTHDDGLGESSEVLNALDFSAGYASEILQPSIRFKTDSNFPSEMRQDNPVIGVVYAFDRLDPFGGVTIKLPRKNPVEVSEPVGKVEHDYRIKLQPAYRSDDVGHSVWDGWQVRTSALYTPVDYEKVSSEGIEVAGKGKRIAAISILGDVQDRRVIRPEPYMSNIEGTRVSYLLKLPRHTIETPGLHIFWIRAKDSSGNWGHPKLVTVPNYEKRQEAQQVNVTEKPAPEGSIFWDDLNSMDQWKGIGHAISRTIKTEKIVKQEHTGIGDSLFVANVGQTLDSARKPISIKFKMLHTKYGRGGGLIILNDAGNQGYGINWDSSSENQYKGQGNVSITKFDSEAPIKYRSPSESLSQRYSSGHVAVGGEYADFEFILDGSSGELVVKVDGVIRSRARDSSFTTFSKIGLKGGKFVLFDDILVMQE